MKDPYKILGVNPSDDDDKIKQAYRELVRKYHPDKYTDSDLAELANEKMKEINAAYEQIRSDRASRSSQGSTSSYQSTDSGSSYNSGSSSFAQIRDLLNRGYLDDAQTLLRNTPESRRDAEWHFLMGILLLRRGHLVDAQNHLDRACRLDPYNQEYRRYADELRTRTAAASGGYRTSNVGGCCSECDICSSLLCADCCCECMGGDLLPCC
ncbi:MAG: DnaJ domain-containing protein [Clostridia bacterium]|nr:DnaJ domain-containing protein [Clostridia bacterium]